jgi:hypothetical protein
MIARHQTILFIVLLAASIGMGVGLWRQLDRAHQRLLAGVDSTPTQAPQVAPAERATLLVASDADNSLLTQVQTLPLPQDPGARARSQPFRHPGRNRTCRAQISRTQACRT